MFNFFKKKEEGVIIKDIVWMSSTAKWNGLFEIWEKNTSTIFIFWFEDTMQQAQGFFSQKTSTALQLIMAREMNSSIAQQQPVIFAEHYPVLSKEKELFEKLHVKEVTITSSLDEPLFKKFGSDKIIDMAKKFGMKESEAIQHSLVTGAIKNAQEKIEKQLQVEHMAHSQQDWLQKNILQ